MLELLKDAKNFVFVCNESKYIEDNEFKIMKIYL